MAAESALPSALAMARLRAIRTNLLPLHRALLDFERTRYERVHGRLGSPQQVLRLVMQDPWFQWLRPLAAAIVQIDERLADDKPVGDDDVDSFRDQISTLVRGDNGDPVFRESYRRALQDSPDVVVQHGKLATFLESLPNSQ